VEKAANEYRQGSEWRLEAGERGKGKGEEVHRRSLISDLFSRVTLILWPSATTTDTFVICSHVFGEGLM
jgi:hypothetical protein